MREEPARFDFTHCPVCAVQGTGLEHEDTQIMWCENGHVVVKDKGVFGTKLVHHFNAEPAANVFLEFANQPGVDYGLVLAYAGMCHRSLCGDPKLAMYSPPNDAMERAATQTLPKEIKLEIRNKVVDEISVRMKEIESV